MDTAVFEQRLKAEGFQEIETKQYPPSPENGEHGHHFSVRGLVLNGEFTVRLDGIAHCYRSGDVFEVEEGLVHTETIGGAGARVLIGRKY